jgi:hypothetical protein
LIGSSTAEVLDRGLQGGEPVLAQCRLYRDRRYGPRCSPGTGLFGGISPLRDRYLSIKGAERMDLLQCHHSRAPIHTRRIFTVHGFCTRSSGDRLIDIKASDCRPHAVGVHKAATKRTCRLPSSGQFAFKKVKPSERT